MSGDKLARALRANTRRRILQILCQEKEISVHGIREKLEITESSASRHLKLLYDLGLVVYHNKPPEKFYSLKIKEIKELFEVYGRIVEQI